MGQSPQETIAAGQAERTAGKVHDDEDASAGKQDNQAWCLLRLESGEALFETAEIGACRVSPVSPELASVIPKLGSAEVMVAFARSVSGPSRCVPESEDARRDPLRQRYAQTRVVLVDDHRAFSEALGMAVDLQQDLRCVEDLDLGEQCTRYYNRCEWITGRDCGKNRESARGGMVPLLR
jgi:hypothetical protein